MTKMSDEIHFLDHQRDELQRKVFDARCRVRFRACAPDTINDLTRSRCDCVFRDTARLCQSLDRSREAIHALQSVEMTHRACVRMPIPTSPVSISKPTSSIPFPKTRR